MQRVKKYVSYFLFTIPWLIIVIAASCAAASDGNYSNTITAARETAWKVITSGQGNAVTLAVMDGGKIVYSEGFGVAERADNRPIDRNTRFNIGSTSKMFIATAVLLLADEGKIALDDPVVKYIPEFVMKDKRYEDITVRMLFNHSSGLPGSTFVFEYKPQSDPHATLLATLKDARLKHDPGAMGIYCNDGFTLAEMIVERVSGKKFVDFLSERVFAPLDMKNTMASVGEKPGNIAEYYECKTANKYPPEVIQVHAAGGLSSTAEDLCRFADSFSPGGKNILSQASLNEILKKQPTPLSSRLEGPVIMDSFGWDYSSLPAYSENGLQLLSKGGGTGFYSTGLQIIPSKRLAVAASVSGRLNGEEVTRPVLDALMKDKGLPVPKKDPLEKPLEAQPIPSDMFGFQGFYANGSRFVKLVFDKKKNTLDVMPVLPDKGKGKNGTVSPLLSFIYNGGNFHCFEKNMHCYFIKNKDTSYFVEKKIPVYGVDVIMFQSIGKIEHPVKLSEDINGKLWLMRNSQPYVELFSDILASRSFTYKALPGYLTFFNPMKIDKPDFADTAAFSFRDQTNMKLTRRDGKLWIKASQFEFSDESSAAVVAPGNNKVVIGADGYNEWLKVGKGSVLSFKKPENGRIILITEGEEDPMPYDSITNSGDVYAPADSLVFLAGSPGDEFTVTAK